MAKKERRAIEYQDPLGAIHKLGIVSGSSEKEISRKGNKLIDEFKKKPFRM